MKKKYVKRRFKICIMYTKCLLSLKLRPLQHIKTAVVFYVDFNPILVFH